MKFSLVQILVVVANIQVRILKTEVEKGFMRTAVGHKLVDPKPKINLVNESWIGNYAKGIPVAKGKQVNIPVPEYGYYYGNVNEIKDISNESGKSYLFFLTE